MQAKDLRNFIQHIRREIDFLAAKNLPVWGTLTWRLKEDFVNGKQKMYTIHSGTFYDGVWTEMGSFSETIEEEVDRIKLAAGEHSLYLNDLLRHMVTVIRGFERDIETQAGHLPRDSSDMLFSLEMQPVQSTRTVRDE